MHKVLCIILFIVVTFGCANNVSVNKVSGTYRTSYPFGTEAITLNGDGSFRQEIALRDQTPITVQGKWEYNYQGNRMNLDGFISVVDGFGHLRSDWRMAKPGLASFDIEMHWFRIIMASAAAYPYAKQ